jgi:integrase/recombinase XerD
LNDLKIKIYQIKSGDHVVCYVDPITQKRKRKSFGSKTEANSHKKDLELRFQSKGTHAFNQTPLGEYMRLHLLNFPNSRAKDRKKHFDSFYREFEKRPISQVGKPELQHWFQKIKTENDLSDRTLNTIKSDINSFFHDLEDQGVIANSPLQKIRFERKPPPRRPRVVLSVDEVHKIIAAAKIHSPRILYPVIHIAAYTGARRGEVLKLKRKDVDFDMNLIHLRLTKNGEDRSIRMSPGLRKFIEEFLQTHDHEFVIPYENGKTVPGALLGKHLRRFRKLFPIGKQWGLHSLRHSFAYNFLKQEGKMYQLQAILGHKSIDVTVDTYGQIGAQDVENACPYEKMESL